MEGYKICLTVLLPGPTILLSAQRLSSYHSRTSRYHSKTYHESWFRFLNQPNVSYWRPMKSLIPKARHCDCILALNARTTTPGWSTPLETDSASRPTTNRCKIIRFHIYIFLIVLESVHINKQKTTSNSNPQPKKFWCQQNPFIWRTM